MYRLLLPIIYLPPRRNNNSYNTPTTTSIATKMTKQTITAADVGAVGARANPLLVLFLSHQRTRCRRPLLPPPHSYLPSTLVTGRTGGATPKSSVLSWRLRHRRRRGVARRELTISHLAAVSVGTTAADRCCRSLAASSSLPPPPSHSPQQPPSMEVANR